jgi:hypothetical protein
MTTAAAPKVIEVNREEWLSQLLLAMQETDENKRY